MERVFVSSNKLNHTNLKLINNINFMNLKISTFVIILFILFYGQKVSAQIKLHIEDLPRFYEAFDSVLSTTDSLKQIEYINKL